MMTAAFTINNGPMLDVEAYGVELLSYTQVNQAEGQVQLAVLRRPDEPFLFALNDKVTLYINGERYFTGLADQGTVLASSTDYRHAHILRDPWTVLENCQWRWDRTTNNYPAHEANSSGIWQLLRNWQKIYLGEYFTMPVWPGQVPQIYPGSWPSLNGPLAVSITSQLKPFILVGQSWDHSTLPPTMIVRNQGDLVLNLDKEKNGVGDAINLTRRDDLKPSCVEIADTDDGWSWTELAPLHPAFNQPNYYWPRPITPGPGGYGSVLVLHSSLSLEQVANNAAKFLYDLLSVPVWEGTFTVQTYMDALDGGSPLRLAPGMTVNLSGEGYRADWSAMNAVIQSVEMDMKTGKATVHVGANGHASLTDIMERARDLLNMRFYNYMLPTATIYSGPLTATPGPASGTGATATAYAQFYGPGATPFSMFVTVQAGTGGFDTTTNSAFVDVDFPDSMAGYFIADLATHPDDTNTPAVNLHATAVFVGNTLRIRRSTFTPVAEGYYQWNITLNNPP